MTILVTGANGFTGSHVVRQLAASGAEVYGLVRSTSDISRIADLDIPLFRGDLTDKPTLERALRGVEVVIHTAAHVDLGVVDEAKMSEVNITGTQHLLECALSAGVGRFVYCSTIGVLGDTAGVVADETFYGERHQFGSPYDRTKYRAQQLVDQYQAKGLDVISLLPSGIMGIGDPHFGGVIKAFAAGRLPFWAGGSRITGVVHVEDVAHALILAMTRGEPGEHYLISAGELTTSQMFAIIGHELNLKPPREAPELLVRMLANIMDPIGGLFKFNPPLSRERVYYLYDRCVRVDASKARKELGWRPCPPEEIMRRLIQ